MNEDWNLLWGRYAGSAERNPAQAFRRDLVARALGLAPGARLVDLGAGQGDLVAVLAARVPGLEILGLDVSTSGLAEAARKVPGARFHAADLTRSLEHLEGCKGWASHATCTELLEHVPDPGSVLRNARWLLAPGARLVVTVPSGPMSAFDKHIGHLGHFRAKDLARLLEDSGYDVERVWRAGFPFFNLYRLTVILRGRKLIGDADGQGELPLLARALMGLFRGLFRLNAVAWGPGWQLVAVARPRP